MFETETDRENIFYIRVDDTDIISGECQCDDEKPKPDPKPCEDDCSILMGIIIIIVLLMVIKNQNRCCCKKKCF